MTRPISAGRLLLRSISSTPLVSRLPNCRASLHTANRPFVTRSTRSSVPTRENKSSFFSTMAFEDVLKGKYPAKAHARRVAEAIRERVPGAKGVLYLEGRMTEMQEDNDSPVPFRQRRYFNYLTGCGLADCHFAYDMATDRSTLFIPPINPDDVIWMGLPVSPEDALRKWDVDEVKFTNEVNAVLAHLASQGSSTVFAIAGQVSEGVTFLGFEEKNLDVLKGVIEKCRVVKDEFEVALIAKANRVSGVAHRAVMEGAKKADNESVLEGTFIGRCIAQGAKEQSYHGIFAGGRAAATLHYDANDKPLAGKQNLLVDAGAEWQCYAADITRTFPLSGKFTPESRAIYDIALRMQTECIGMLKAGILWDDVHLRAHEVAVEGLLAIGILKGDKDEIMKARTSVAFFPHGLGHHLGMDTHDVGGNPNPEDEDRLFRYLRLRGRVPAGSVVTVEPGVYFCDFIIKPYLEDPAHSKFIDASVLDKYWDVGGVRIEDNLVITETGCENLTDAPKDPEELERIISGQ